MPLGPQTRALVTGSSRGIGRAIALELAARGCTVGLVARSERDLEEVAAEARARSGQALVLPADVGVREQVERATATFVEREGGVDLVFANAGIACYGPFRDAAVEEAERMTQVNWLGTLYTVKAALPHLLGQAGGRIVVTSSAAGFRAFPWAAAYGATKFAQRGFLEALRHELSGTGVEVTGFYPGEVEAHLHDDARARERMPDWRKPGAAMPPERAARALLKGVEQGRREVFVPPIARALGVLHGISPRLADRMLRAAMGATAAPAR